MVTMDMDETYKFVKNGIRKFMHVLKSGVKVQGNEHILLYQAVYRLYFEGGCVGQELVQLYNIQQKGCKKYIKHVVLPALREKQDEFMVKELVRCWENYKNFATWLTSIFGILDSYIKREKLLSLSEIQLLCFKNDVFLPSKIDMKDTMLKLIERERENQHIDSTLLKTVTSLFVDMGMDVYRVDLEEPIILDTVTYYTRKAASWIEFSFPEFMLKAEECLNHEDKGVGNYLHVSSLKKIQLQIREFVGFQCLQQLEKSGLVELLRDKKVEDLSRMYRLFSEIPNDLDSVVSAFRSQLTEEGMALVKEAEESTKKEEGFIGRLIELDEKYLEYVVDCFRNDKAFDQASHATFTNFCNKSVSGKSTAELLAVFCDSLFKSSGASRPSDEAMDDTLKKAVMLLRYITDKDIFQVSYKSKLSRRLLFGKSAYDPHEVTMLNLMREGYGLQFTKKMETMIKDATFGREENQAKWDAFLNANPQSRPRIDFAVTTLTANSWPSYKTTSLSLPEEMAMCVEAFNRSYSLSNNNKKLIWLHSQGTCHIAGHFEAGEIELIVAPYQAACLLLFNNHSGSLSYTDIKDQLNLPDEDINRVLHSLSCSKYNILNKDPSTKTVGMEDVFKFNTNFSSRTRRIKVPLPPLKEENKAVVEEVARDRKYEIQACMVRIMKSRKTFLYEALVSEAIEQLSKTFKPDVKDIKRQIEDLILKEYLRRDEHEPNKFHYVA